MTLPKIIHIIDISLSTAFYHLSNWSTFLYTDEKNQPSQLYIYYPTGLEDHFTVVWWDQRGAGLSFIKDIDKSTITTNQYIDDTIAVTNYLRERFGQKKIYLMAHSWGSYFGIQAVQKAQQLYNAYIGIGQVTYYDESERLAYEYMLDCYPKVGDDNTLEKLKENNYLSDGYDKILNKMAAK